MFGIKRKVTQAAKRLGFLTAGLICCVVGAGFLTAALWIILAAAEGVLIATAVVGSAYLGLGLILVAVGSRGQPEQPVHHNVADQPKADLPDSPPIVQAFMYGLQAGAQADQARHSRSH